MLHLQEMAESMGSRNSMIPKRGRRYYFIPIDEYPTAAGHTDEHLEAKYERPSL